FVSTRRAMMREALEGGVTRRQFRPDLDVELMLDVIHGAFWYRLLSGTADPLDDAFADDLVELLRPNLTPRLVPRRKDAR
ncbi:MAG TPA: TetR-like C-terminal domain-containing protein, partial [Hyphomicrobiaceae bacterium]|nr:TetR-like C-terminal domain-containing protein [Hyphomicrobiaceae bacterium]